MKLRVTLLLILGVNCSNKSDSPMLLPLAESVVVGGSSPIGCLVSAWPFAPNAYLADIVTEAPGQNQYRYGDPLCATNGVYGSAGGSGSTDVYSLKSSLTSVYCVPNEKCIVLEWANSRVLDSTGVDFVVFENPFNRSESARFIEAVIVEVSEDGHNWCGWNPTYLGETNNTLPNFIADIYNPAKYERLAGIEPVLFNQSNWQYSATDIFDHSKAGGDHFDLSGANFGSSGNGCNVATKTQIQLNGFVYLRLTTANSRDGASFPLPPDSFDATADIDGVVAKQISNR